jgi:hypothetical protein
LRKIPSTGFASNIPDILFSLLGDRLLIIVHPMEKRDWAAEALGLLPPRKTLSTECDISDALFSCDHLFLDQTIPPDLFELLECKQDLDNTPLSLASETSIADFDISTVYDILTFHGG